MTSGHIHTFGGKHVFGRGLTSNQKEILINPEQVLYARKAGHRKSILVLASGSELVLDQDVHSVELLFDEYFHGFIDASSSSSVLAGLRFATDATSGVRGESGSAELLVAVRRARSLGALGRPKAV